MSELEVIIKKVNKEMGSEVISYGVNTPNIPRIPMSSPRLNYMLYGGVPMNKVIEFCGTEGGGKTTTALDLVANYQHLPDARKVLYVDHEHALEEYWATLLGVDVAGMIIYRPETESAEDIFDVCIELLKTGEIGCMVIDSLGSLVPKSIIDENLDKQQMGGIAKVLTRVSNVIVPLLTKYKCTLVGINQVRDDMNSMYNPYTTPGGKAWKHACSLRLMFSKGSLIDEDGNELKASAENPQGNRVMIKALKMRGIRPDRTKGYYTLNYRTGIDYMLDTIDVAIELKLIVKKGGWYYFCDLETGEISDEKIQGLANLREYFKNNDDKFSDLYDKVYDMVGDMQL